MPFLARWFRFLFLFIAVSSTFTISMSVCIGRVNCTCIDVCTRTYALTNAHKCVPILACVHYSATSTT